LLLLLFLGEAGQNVIVVAAAACVHEFVVAAAIGHQVVGHILGVLAAATLGSGQKSFHLSDRPRLPQHPSQPATPPCAAAPEKFRVCMLIKVITWRTPPKGKQKPKW